MAHLDTEKIETAKKHAELIKSIGKYVNDFKTKKQNKAQKETMRGFMKDWAVEYYKSNGRWDQAKRLIDELPDSEKELKKFMILVGKSGTVISRKNGAWELQYQEKGKGGKIEMKTMKARVFNYDDVYYDSEDYQLSQAQRGGNYISGYDNGGYHGKYNGYNIDYKRGNGFADPTLMLLIGLMFCICFVFATVFGVISGGCCYLFGRYKSQLFIDNKNKNEYENINHV